MGIVNFLAETTNWVMFLDTYAFFRRKLTKSQIVILAYHRVCPRQDNWSFESLSPDIFEKHVEYFSRGFEIISLEDLVVSIRQGKSLPEKAVIFTFDDGYRDNYTYAYPILKKHGVPATIFLTTGHIGTDKLFWWDMVSYVIHHTSVNQINIDELGTYPVRSVVEKTNAKSGILEKLKTMPEKSKNILIDKLCKVSGVNIPDGLGKELIMSWREIKEMSGNGIDFGAHTVNHPILTNMPLEQAKWEIIQSRKDIEEKVGQKVVTFSYPNGDYNTELTVFIEASGFKCAVTMSCGLIRSRSNIYTLDRIGPDGEFNKFKVKFCGLWGDLQRALRRKKG